MWRSDNMCMYMVEIKQDGNLLSTVLSMNPFNLYWKSSWAASSLDSPPGNTTSWTTVWSALTALLGHKILVKLHFAVGLYTNTPAYSIGGTHVQAKTEAYLTDAAEWLWCTQKSYLHPLHWWGHWSCCNDWGSQWRHPHHWKAAHVHAALLETTDTRTGNAI